MSGVFGGGKSSSAAPPPPVPIDATPTDLSPATQEARKRVRLRNSMRSGRPSTILTGAEGITGIAGTQRATLLGG